MGSQSERCANPECGHPYHEGKCTYSHTRPSLGRGRFWSCTCPQGVLAEPRAKVIPPYTKATHAEARQPAKGKCEHLRLNAYVDTGATEIGVASDSLAVDDIYCLDCPVAFELLPADVVDHNEEAARLLSQIVRITEPGRAELNAGGLDRFNVEALSKWLAALEGADDASA